MEFMEEMIWYFNMRIKGGNMRKSTKGEWTLVAIMAGIIITLVILITFSDFDAETEIASAEIQGKSQIVREQEKLTQQKSQVQEKLYKDDGSGMMMIRKFSSRQLEERYLQWKEDYPERDKKTVAIGVSGTSAQFNYFVLIYKTETK